MPAKKRLNTKTIRQTTTFACKPEDVYDALMNSKKHSFFTQSKVIISPKVGGKFSSYDGYAEGTNLELIPNKRIVQSWRASDWPVGHYSTVEFELFPLKKGTKLVFVQKQLPAACAIDIAEGWKQYYWKPMKVMLER
jgi:activator of HSP90 ATPase